MKCYYKVKDEWIKGFIYSYPNRVGLQREREKNEPVEELTLYYPEVNIGDNAIYVTGLENYSEDYRLYRSVAVTVVFSKSRAFNKLSS